MTVSVKDAGVWKAAQIYVKNAGVWKTVLQGYVKVAGVWTLFTNSFSVFGGTQNYSADNNDVGPGTVTATFNTDGTVTLTLDGSTTTSAWGTPTPTTGAGNSYWIKFFAKTGSGVISSPALPTAVLALSSNRSVVMNGAGTPGSVSANVPYEIYSDAGGTTLVQSGTITFHSGNS